MFHAVGLCIKLDFNEFFAIAAIVFQEFHAYPSCALLEDRQSNQARTASEEIHPRNISTHIQLEQDFVFYNSSLSRSP
jgi:hypothetical protein